MKLGILVGTPDLRQPWCTILDGPDLMANIAQVARWGYDGIELAIRDPEVLDADQIKACCRENNIEVIGLCTGEIFGSDGLGLVSQNTRTMEMAFQKLQQAIDLAGDLGSGVLVNIGRVRGSATTPAGIKTAVGIFQSLSDFALEKDVRLILEPVNHYEVDFVHTTQEGIEIANSVNRPNFGLMLDTYHMNIEDQDLRASIQQAEKYCWHVHVSDNNRKYPGNAHICFSEIVRELDEINYDGYLSAEILPWPDPQTAGVETIEFLQKTIQSVTKGQSR